MLEVAVYLLLATSALGLALLVVIYKSLKKDSKKRNKVEATLTRDQLAKLREEASRQYETAMVRQLQRFEKEMTKLTDDLLLKMQQKIGQPDVELEKTVNALVDATTQGYSAALDETVNGLKARLASADALLASHAQAADKAVQALVEERKAKVLSKLDATLEEIFADYMATVAAGLDLSDQQEYIIRQLESIKPQLIEDIKRVS
jgi:paraquat-inducible protein B